MDRYNKIFEKTKNIRFKLEDYKDLTQDLDIKLEDITSYLILNIINIITIDISLLIMKISRDIRSLFNSAKAYYQLKGIYF